MKKTILFDLDGTITDSGEGIIRCAQATLKHFGLPVPEAQSMRDFVGPPLRESFPKYGVPPQDIAQAIHVYRSRYNTVGKFENGPYPGIEELLIRLKEVGCQLYVATSKPETISMEILEYFRLAQYFDRICGAASDGLRNTKSQVISYLLEETGASDPVMVGDTKYDVLGAKAFGIPTIGVAWGYGTVQELLEAGAVSIAHTMEKLCELLICRD